MDLHFLQGNSPKAQQASREENLGEGTWGNNERNETNRGIPRRDQILRKSDTITSLWF